MPTSTALVNAPPARLRGRERGRLATMGLVVLALNVAGWAIFAFAVIPHHFQFTGLGLGLGVAFTAPCESGVDHLGRGPRR